MTCCLSAQGLSPSAREDDFAAFIEIFKENYAYINRAAKPWESWHSRYRVADTCPFCVGAAAHGQNQGLLSGKLFPEIVSSA